MNNVFFAIFHGNPPYSIGKQTKKIIYININNIKYCIFQKKNSAFYLVLV